ncbi:hypothetical protein J6590_099162 [Homalodisca vitripennis]|nr:hypothetical protein J6590_099162 [Homalodisca vitripennis]
MASRQAGPLERGQRKKVCSASSERPGSRCYPGTGLAHPDQSLIGHGYFKSYLIRMGKNGSLDCICFVFSVDTVCENIMDDDGNWDCLSQFVRGILLEKKPDLDREVAQIP